VKRYFPGDLKDLLKVMPSNTAHYDKNPTSKLIHNYKDEKWPAALGLSRTFIRLTWFFRRFESNEVSREARQRQQGAAEAMVGTRGWAKLQGVKNSTYWEVQQAGIRGWSMATAPD
jgi:hypothetical protein